MFTDSNYDVLDFLPPANGMNRNIGKDVLPSNFAYVFENVLPVPKGETQVRYGTQRIINTLVQDTQYSVIESFPFQKTNGAKQFVVYIQYFKIYTNPTNIVRVAADQFSFTSNGIPDFFEEDTLIQIQYNAGQGVETTVGYIKKITIQNNGTISIVLKESLLRTGATIESFAFSKGRIVVYDFATNAILPNIGVDNLHVGVVPRAVTYLNTLIMCNGVDPLYSWNGTTFERVYDFVKEQAQTFTRVSPKRFTFVANASFNISKYQNNASIRISVNNVQTDLTVSSVSKAGDIVTLVIVEDLPAFTGRDRIELFYKDYPPAFSYMHVAHDRIWALAPGAVGLSYRTPQEALRVYYTYRTRSLTDWFNENTKTVPSIDISAKHEIPDNLEAILSIGGYVAFVGRKKTQVWSGQDPTNPDSPLVFAFSSLLPVGIVHGNLFVELPNDTFFISQNDIFSFGTLNIARQFAATSTDAINPLVRNYAASITESNEAYRACRAFKYPSGSFCGFKIGFNPVLIGMYSTNIYAWSIFSGDFKFSSTFLTTLDSALYLFINQSIYQYADGISIPPVYGDQNGENVINFMWSLPTTQLQGRKFANSFYEIDLKYPSSFALNSENNIYISIDGNVRETFSLEHPYAFKIRGDVMGTIPLLERGAPDPDDPSEDSLGMRVDIPYARLIERLKFVSSKFLVTVFGQCKDGAVRFSRLKLFGKTER